MGLCKLYQQCFILLLFKVFQLFYFQKEIARYSLLSLVIV